MSWSQFLKMHWGMLAAADFFTVEVSTWYGLVTYYVQYFGQIIRAGSFMRPADDNRDESTCNDDAPRDRKPYNVPRKLDR
jgi:hypothetical protein